MSSATTTGTEKLSQLQSRFQELFGGAAIIARAPGRVNLIGEHTDYNDGFVMPVAIGYYTWVAAAPRSDYMLLVHSEHFNETAELELKNLAGPPTKHWSDYVRGVAAELGAAEVNVAAANLLIDSNVPLGAGLSSSAALELSLAIAIARVSRHDLPKMDMVRLAQRAEHNYVGTRCGIMDQFVSAFGQEEGALLLDCRSLRYRLVPIPDDVRIVICNSMVRHELASGEYNRRRADCEAGVQELRKFYPNISALRDVTLTQLLEHESSLSLRVLKRCRHVISENARVQAAAAAMERKDCDEFGRLMYSSHQSLKSDYEVSCPELDLLVEIASGCKGVFGARMTGGGFGGCTVNLVRVEAVEEFQQEVSRRYKLATDIAPDIMVTAPAAGASLIQ